jgi:hypothetical protein
LFAVGTPAHAQLKVEEATRTLDLKRAKLDRVKAKTIKLGTHRARYAYQIAGIRRLLKLQGHIRRCVETQRMVGGEFHDRLDFLIEPSGKLKKFSTYRRTDQLEACLTPHVLPIKFPRFSGKPTFLLQVGVGSPGCRLGRRVKAKPAVAVYPIGTPEEKKRYRMAIFWVGSPWSHAIGRCSEWIDRTMGFGYQTRLASEVSPGGRVLRTAVRVKGKLAPAAIDHFVRCVTPFLKLMRLPKHGGPGAFIYKQGSNTARWGLDD